MPLLANVFSLFLLFMIMSIVMFIIHESNNQGSHLIVPEWMSRIKTMSKQHTQEVVKQKEIQILNAKPPLKKQTDKIAEVLLESLDPEENEEEEDEEKKETKESIKIKEPKLASKANTIDSKPSNAFTEPQPTPQPLHALLHDDNAEFQGGETEKKGTLVCHGKEVESEVIYWRKVKGDRHYESPITPHHENHHDKYLSFEYDNGGWNNVRMSLECLLVVAHAMGRTLVVPPQQHLYLLGNTHKDKHDTSAHDEMGFEDFFDLELLKSQLGFHMMSMEEFLAKEGATGGLNPSRLLLPKNDTKLWGRDLWFYLNKVADLTPSWMGRVMIFPDHPGDMNLNVSQMESHIQEYPHIKNRLHKFQDGRGAIFYDKSLQDLHHIHIRGDSEYRVLQHHYAFTFFADPKMQSFYKRFIRDYVRYKDSIHCYGHELIQAVRADSLKENPAGGGEYYALHIRRGDLQFKEVKISAAEIVKNLNFTVANSTYILIPPGSLVYLSTDDPDGVCRGCLFNRKPCESYPHPRPVGCPDDPSWQAMIDFGWKIRFLRDYQKQGYVTDANPNTLGMIESIVCSRAKEFAGTYFSTFTGYIHRLRGFHGLGEHTYYHYKSHVESLRGKESVGHGWSREYRVGWTDDAGELI